MTVDLDWAALDAQLSQKLRDNLNMLFSRTSLPSYLGPLSVVDFVFGDAPPLIELVDIKDINPDFLAEECSDGGSDGPTTEATAADADDVQLQVRIQYSGNLRIELKTQLLINYPSSLFMSLPLRLNLTSLDFCADAILALQPNSRRAHISLTAPPLLDAEHHQIPPNSFTSAATSQDATTQIIRDLKCDPSEVGDADKHVLRNVGKVEKFVLQLVRSLLESEVVWPNYITIDY